MKINPTAVVVWFIAGIIGWLIAGPKGLAIGVLIMMTLSLLVTLWNELS